MNNPIFKKILLIFVFLFCFSFFVFSLNYVSAYEFSDDSTANAMNSTESSFGAMAIQVKDGAVKAAQKVGNFITKYLDKVDKLLQKAGSKALGSAIQNSMKQLAYNTATDLASGGEGQKPKFYVEDWGDYISNTVDSAAGQFLEELGKDNNGMNLNLCNPSFNLKFRVGTGIIQDFQEDAGDCTFTQMTERWSNQLSKFEDMQADDFLNRAQYAFDPKQNELGQAFSMHMAYQTNLIAEEEAAKQNRVESGGWVGYSGVDNRRESVPGNEQSLLDSTRNLMTSNFGEFTGNALVDAGNVFLNQFLITLMNKKLSELGKGKETITSGGVTAEWLTNPDAGPGASGAAGAEENLRKIIEPTFTVRGDYEILAELTICPDPENARPSNCVITDSFSQAISERLTVGQAVEQGYISPDFTFGFLSGGLEPDYNSGIPYRSMKILRKYRIIPVGWELAAQYIQNNFSAIGVEGGRSIEDIISCFADDDSYDNGYSEDWCHGLVDPNWVLKAPQNFCRREGPGGVVVAQEVVGSGDNSRLTVVRDDEYCADNLSCISETEDGVCEFYGYCTEERREWEFDTESCEPRNNTCQTFSGEGGQKVSFLKNTLDWSNCSADSAGCGAYCQDYNLANETFTCSNNHGDNIIFLDSDASECDEGNEGCHEFVRTDSDLGVNLLVNSSFEDYVGTINDSIDDDVRGWGTIGQIVGDAYDGEAALLLDSSFNQIIEVGPSDWQVAEHSYSLSFYARNCSNGDTIRLGGASSTITQDIEWRRYTMTNLYPATNLSNYIDIIFNISATCEIDAIKLEQSPGASAYSEYRQNGLVYQKLAPDYLNCSSPTVSNKCSDYVQECRADEVGCDLYTSLSDRISIPAVVDETDFCPSECVGYDEYLQTVTHFDSSDIAWLIPRNERRCNVDAVGCDEFTNLDRLDEGGEAREYYSQLRQCQKPDASCAEFYTWEGSSESGFQLKVFSLANDGATNEPQLTQDDSTECSEAIYNLPPTDPGYNPDCREFYNRDGNISYHLYSRTISCSDNCHPYRRTKKNIDDNLGAGTCNAFGYNAFYGVTDANNNQFYWDGVDCYYCKNGGVWDSQHGACIYNAIPGEGRRCSASQSGCREYTGPNGSNQRVVLNESFESGSIDDWGGDLDANNPNNMSLVAGGHSLFVTDAPAQPRIASTSLGKALSKDNSYVISFLARANGAGDFTRIGIGSNEASMIEFTISPAASNLGPDWRLYEFNLAKLNNAGGNYEVSSGDSLFIESDIDIYLDDIRLIEIVDRYYLIQEDVWNIPDSCYRDAFGNVNPVANLGCDAYSDRESQTHYIARFSNLCQDSAVGCELMIDTNNYSDYFGNAWNEDVIDGVCDVNDGLDCLAVSGDIYRYIVYDPEKQCNSSQKGCERLGETEEYVNSRVFEEVYLLNDPDSYDRILCSEEGAGCQEWDSDDGVFYFKDPGDQICEWRQEYGTSESRWSWFKKKVNRCDVDNDGAVLEFDPICQTDDDCPSGACMLDETDHLCPIDNYKTFGFGGYGRQISQPGADTDSFPGEIYYWAGVCSNKDSGCTEYIDPMSSFNPNLIANSDFSQNVDGPTNIVPDYWVGTGDNEQIIDLEPNTLYVLAVNGVNRAQVIAPLDPFSGNPLPYFNYLDSSNNLDGPYGTIEADNLAGNAGRLSRLFYTANALTITLRVDDASLNNPSDIELKKAAVNYQLKENIDYTSCNGLVSFDKSCILFNERAQNSSVLSGLVYDADQETETPQLGAAGENDSNVLVKVQPERTCDKWLACRSYIKGEDGDVCYDVGMCNGVNQNGSCSSFVLSPLEEQTFNPASPGPSSQFANKTGYSLAGLANHPDQSDLFPLDRMEQVGEGLYFMNGGFELSGGNGYPIGWNLDAPNIAWDKNYYLIISDPVSSQNEGIGFAPEGHAFLKVGEVYGTVSDEIEVSGSTEYMVSGLMNTQSLGESYGQIVVREYDENDSQTAYHPMTSPAGRDWEFLSQSFETDPDTIKIKIAIKANGAGNIYVDDIKVRPALQVRSGTVDLAPQTCRLYPNEEALSCDYYSESGYKMKGWWGYCLEYDHAPGSEDVCLTWWPVDRVKGDGEGDSGRFAGYSDKYPVYYCDEIDGNFRLLEHREERLLYYESEEVSCLDQFTFQFISWSFFGGFPTFFHEYDSDSEGVGNHCPAEFSVPSDLLDPNNRVVNGGYYLRQVVDDPGCDWDDTDKDIRVYIYCTPIGYQGTVNGQNERVFGQWYEYNGNLVKFDGLTTHGGEGGYDETEDGVMFQNLYNPNHPLIDPAEYNVPCTQVTQVVNPTGQNKAWMGRVNIGSEYQAHVLGYEYSSDDAPFGSALPPSPLSNPFEWDSSSKAGIQPLYFLPQSSGKVRAGSVYSCDGERCGCDGSVGNDTCIAYGRCEITGDVCLHVPYNRPEGTVIWDCETSDQAPCYQNWDQSFMKCPDGEECIVDNLNIDEVPNMDHVIANQQRLFAKSYGTYMWSSPIMEAGRYTKITGSGWSPPENLCNNGSGLSSARPEYNPDSSVTCVDPWGADSRCCFDADGNNGSCLDCPSEFCDWCGVRPVINNININDTSLNQNIHNSQFVNLTFNSMVDSNQMPLVGIYIDWGDNERTVISGTEMHDKPDAQNPHSFFHLYSYWDMRQKHAIGSDTIYCEDEASNDLANSSGAILPGAACPGFGSCCAVVPSVKIKDNWNWCNNGVDGDPCPDDGYVDFSSLIYVSSQ